MRRLFKYIEEFAVNNNCYFFITTHSNVVIDLFSNSPNAQIVHVTHNGKYGRSCTIGSFDGHNFILDDIGAKASDLLQANGIIWLEGPSDRLYFNKWVELFSQGKLREHRDYECAFYGGALLSHFDAQNSSDACEAVNIMRINRNAILIGDSDKTSKSSRLKPRLIAIKKAIEDVDGYVWVTAVKEVENYIPAAILSDIYQKQKLQEIGQYEYFYRNNRKSKKLLDQGYWQKNRFPETFDKVMLAESVVQRLTKDILSNKYDLEKEIKHICRTIEKWNQR